MTTDKKNTTKPTTKRLTMKDLDAKIQSLTTIISTTVSSNATTVDGIRDDINALADTVKALADAQKTLASALPRKKPAPKKPVAKTKPAPKKSTPKKSTKPAKKTAKKPTPPKYSFRCKKTKKTSEGGLEAFWAILYVAKKVKHVQVKDSDGNWAFPEEVPAFEKDIEKLGEAGVIKAIADAAPSNKAFEKVLKEFEALAQEIAETRADEAKAKAKKKKKKSKK